MSAGICRCRECQFWDSEPDASNHRNKGRCLYAPPRVELVPVQGIGGQGLSAVAVYPETRALDGCGFGDKSYMQPSSIVAN